jgi:hypothetical protein
MSPPTQGMQQIIPAPSCQDNCRIQLLLPGPSKCQSTLSLLNTRITFCCYRTLNVHVSTHSMHTSMTHSRYRMTRPSKDGMRAYPHGKFWTSCPPYTASRLQELNNAAFCSWYSAADAPKVLFRRIENCAKIVIMGNKPSQIAS